ncbi:MAG TPA: NfeD family protein [Myxococcales bacterium]|nr:NfeD family protein [Myxococcales bacterium]
MTALLAAAFVAYAEFTGSVDPGSGDFIEEAIRNATEQGAEALVVRIDTPGGLLSTTRDIVQSELSAKVPIVFWVGPPGARAGSAGVFLTLAAHIAAMAPSSNIGAAHPVELSSGEEKKEPSTMEKKIENDTAAFVHGIAERRSRNVEWAEKAVRESESITASKALELKVIDLIAEDLPELLRKIDGRRVDLGGGDVRTLHTASAEIRNVSWSVKDKVLHGLADPEIAYLIAMLGVIGVMLELFHPGTVVPGVVGGICIIIAAMAFQMVPVNVGAALLLLAGVGLFVAEMYIGGHGGFIAAGIVCVVIGSLLLVGHVDKGFYADYDFGLGWRVVAPVGIALAVIAGTLAWKFSQSARRPLDTGAQALIGAIGEMRDDGTLLVAGELWKTSSQLPPGTRARVVSVRGLTLDVAAEES